MQAPRPDAITRFRMAAELVAAPELKPYKDSIPTLLGPAALDALRRVSDALVRHVWGLVEAAYHVSNRQPFCVAYHTNKMCTLAITPDAQVALDAAMALWPYKRTVVAVVDPVRDVATHFDVSTGSTTMASEPAESFIALAAALTYRAPPWLPS